MQFLRTFDSSCMVQEEHLEEEDDWGKGRGGECKGQTGDLKQFRIMDMNSFINAP